MQPRGGDRKVMAIFNVLIARSRFMRLLTAQPMSSQLFAIGSRTTGEGRECRSRITARYSHPWGPFRVGAESYAKGFSL
jgi:hypothetical protein